MKFMKKALIAAAMMPTMAMAASNQQLVLTPVDGVAANKVAFAVGALSDKLGVKKERVMFDGSRLVVSVSDKVPLDRVMTVLEGLPVIEMVEKDILVKVTNVPNDPLYSRQWALFEDAGGIRSQDAHKISTGANTVISVIDTGYVPHPDLDANRLPGYDMVSNASNARDGNGRDANAIDEGDYTTLGQCGAPSDSSWHGSHVAGISSAVTDNGTGMAGAAPDSKFVPVRALASCGGFMSDIADGVVWSAGVNVPGTLKNMNPADVINLSLGGAGQCSSYMQDAVDVAVENGAVVVVAAGNDGRDASATTPANCNNVVTVASTGRDGAKASYSNFGLVVDVAAPGGGNGGGILSTIDSGRQDRQGPAYAEYQGTSMATPYVAGVVSLMKSVDKSITPAEVEEVLKETARDFPGACVGCGTGIVDAEAAVKEVLARKGGEAPNPDPEPQPEPQPEPEPEMEEVQYGGAMYKDIADARRFLILTRVTTTVVDLNVAKAGEDGKVRLVIDHPRQSDLTMQIERPDGSSIALRAEASEGSQTLYTADVGNTQSGDYQLQIVDRVPQQRGAVRYFDLTQSQVK